MIIATKNISIQDETFVLTNQRAAFWEKGKALILSDLHVGKTAHFRKNGIALANHIMKSDLARLSALIEYFCPDQLIVVGDLLHAGDNSDVDEFCKWRNLYPEIQFCLIEGNHDRLSEALEKKLCLNVKTALLEISGFTFIHDFEKTKPGFQITGHIHPGIILHSAVKSIRLPCYAVNDTQLLLPAFSQFTGLDTKNLPEKSKFFVFTDSEIYEV